ncbi:MAG TPA: SPFH/Band 7/PHB domain protein [Clostridia bacterium]|nr:SPFH/Band 7/PHB domain protein [Clostridia bacterium]HHY06240.1 SPFH/Band 7/PHB domain protein [Clostridia bacterium]
MLYVILIIVILLIGTNVRVVPQTEAYIIERLGAYLCTWFVGLHFKIPIIDRIAMIVPLKEQIKDFRPQPVITKDNVTITIDTVVFYQVTDPKAYAYGVENPILAIDNITTTSLRNIIGELELDQTLTSRDIINSRMRSVLDAATGAWGIKVHRVEVKNIVPPAEIQDAMERQMKAERERREAILRAEGEKESAIRVAQGHKEAVVLNAEAEKTSAILIAEAKKEAAIREAEGEAEAILKVQRATAEGLKMLKNAAPDNQVIALKSLEALAEVADGQATKLIIPSEIQNLTALAVSLAEVVKEKDKSPVALERTIE